MRAFLLPGLIALGAAAARAQVAPDADISEYGLGKLQVFYQSSAAAPTFVSYSFRTFVNQQNGGIINSATATGAGPGSPYTLFDRGGAYGYDSYEYLEQNYASGTAFAAAYPNGAYTLTVNTPHHVNTPINFTLSPDAFPVDIPTITGGTWSGGMLVINAAVTSTITFNSFSSMINNVDLIEMTFEGETNGVGITTSNPTSSFVLNANTLNPNETYAATLTFYKRVSGFTASDPLNPIPGADGMGFYAFKTYFAVQAIPEPETYALMAAGAALLGWAARRRRSCSGRLSRGCPNPAVGGRR
jgi:hypothetical protein